MRLYTAEEYSELVTYDKHSELVRGVIEVRDSPTWSHEYTVMELGFAIRAYLETHPLGAVAGPVSVKTERGPDTVRITDLAFITYERMEPEMAPDLVVEVLSPSNTPREMAAKMAEYFAKGTRMMWIFDPKNWTVAVYAREAKPYIAGRGDILDGGDVLPGFRVEVKKLFGWPPKDPRRPSP
jgi:Uma2 family endonuclease